MTATKVRKIQEPSSGERTFMHYWEMFGDASMPYKRELLFHDVRGWRFDFAWDVPHKVAIEVEGGTGSGGRHTRFVGYQEDCEKYNAAVLYGWKLLRFTPQMLEADPETCIGQVLQLLGLSKPKVRIVVHPPSLGGTDLCTCQKFTGENVLNCAVCGGFRF